MRPFALVRHLVGIKVRVIEDDTRPVSDATQRVAGGIHPHFVAADSVQLVERAIDRSSLLPGVGSDADQVGQEAGLAFGHRLRKSRGSRGKR